MQNARIGGNYRQKANPTPHSSTAASTIKTKYIAAPHSTTLYIASKGSGATSAQAVKSNVIGKEYKDDDGNPYFEASESDTNPLVVLPTTTRGFADTLAA